MTMTGIVVNAVIPFILAVILEFSKELLLVLGTDALELASSSGGCSSTC